MVDIDGDVVDFCSKHLTKNKAAFASDRLTLVIDDAKKALEVFLRILGNDDKRLPIVDVYINTC